MQIKFRTVIFLIVLKLAKASEVKEIDNNIDNAVERKNKSDHFVSDCELTALPPDPKSGCCGLHEDKDLPLPRSKRSLGGAETGVMQYPWLVLLDYPQNKYLDSISQMICGGFLISGLYVVTSAHCVPAHMAPNAVRLGEFDRNHKGPDCLKGPSGTSCTEGVLYINIKNITVHPGYDRNNNHTNDIALLKLENTAPYTDYIRPICLPSSDITSTIESTVRLYFSGWGLVGQLYSSAYKSYRDIRIGEKTRVELPYVPLAECQIIYDNRIQSQKWMLSPRQMCAGGERGVSPCSGDSGGPLMYKQETQFEAIGVLSLVSKQPCGFRDVPAVFTKLFEYRSWIKDVINS